MSQLSDEEYTRGCIVSHVQIKRVAPMSERDVERMLEDLDDSLRIVQAILEDTGEHMEGRDEG